MLAVADVRLLQKLTAEVAPQGQMVCFWRDDENTRDRMEPSKHQVFTRFTADPDAVT